MIAEEWSVLYLEHRATCKHCTDPDKVAKIGLCLQGKRIWRSFVSARFSEMRRMF